MLSESCSGRLEWYRIYKDSGWTRHRKRSLSESYFQNTCLSVHSENRKPLTNKIFITLELLKVLFVKHLTDKNANKISDNFENQFLGVDEWGSLAHHALGICLDAR